MTRIARHTLPLLPSSSHEDCIDNTVDFSATKRGQIRLLEMALDPLDLAFFNALHQSVVQCCIFRCNKYGIRADLERPRASCTCKWI